MREIKQAIILMNLGSPDSTEVKDVKRYLNEFLMDGRVIDYPYFLRTLLVKGIIVPFRAPKSAEAYKSIWTEEGSPLIVFTEQLQKAVQDHTDIPVLIAMRYGNPSIKEAYNYISGHYKSVSEVILVPLYPHYAMSSYETAVEQAKEIHKSRQYAFRLSIIRPYYNNEQYIGALSTSIKPYLNDYDHFLFSYHGVPERHIKKGDITGYHCLQSDSCCQTPSEAHKQCYRHQCFETTRLVVESLSIPASKYSMSFQSRLGRAEWLKPYTSERLRELPGEGVKKLAVACPAFVSDCLETLEEIAKEGRHIFMEAGGESFTMIPCLNTNQEWVDCITSWTNDAAAGKTEMIL